MQKNPSVPQSSQLLNFIFFFFKTNFYSVNGVWFGDIRYAPGGSLGFCAISMSFLLHFFYKSDFDEHKNSQEDFLIFLPRSTPQGFITNLVEQMQ